MRNEKKGLLILFLPEQFMMENGSANFEMASAHSFGLMEPDMKGNGRLTKLMAKESFSMWILTFSMDNGLTIKPMGMEFMYTKLEPGTKETGKMTDNMGMGLKHGLMEVGMKGTLKMERKKGKECIIGLITPNTMATGAIT